MRPRAIAATSLRCAAMNTQTLHAVIHAPAQVRDGAVVSRAAVQQRPRRAEPLARAGCNSGERRRARLQCRQWTSRRRVSVGRPHGCEAGASTHVVVELQQPRSRRRARCPARRAVSLPNLAVGGRRGRSRCVHGSRARGCRALQHWRAFGDGESIEVDVEVVAARSEAATGGRASASQAGLDPNGAQRRRAAPDVGSDGCRPARRIRRLSGSASWRRWRRRVLDAASRLAASACTGAGGSALRAVLASSHSRSISSSVVLSSARPSSADAAARCARSDAGSVRSRPAMRSPPRRCEVPREIGEREQHVAQLGRNALEASARPHVLVTALHRARLFPRRA